MSKEENKKYISTYTTKEVSEFLKSLGLEELNPKIEELQIEGYDLCINNNDLFNSLEILNPHNLIKLKKNINLELLKELKIYFSFLGNLYPIQLENDPNLTIENISQNISEAFNINEKFALSTMDNKILSSKLKFINLFLLEPEKYKTIKIFNPKEINYNQNQLINKNKMFDTTPSPISRKSDIIKKELENIPYTYTSNTNTFQNEENQFIKNQNNNKEKEQMINIQIDNNYMKDNKEPNNYFPNNYQYDNNRKSINIFKKDSFSSPHFSPSQSYNKINQRNQNKIDILGDLSNNLKLMKENLLKNNIELEFQEPLLNIENNNIYNQSGALIKNQILNPDININNNNQIYNNYNKYSNMTTEQNQNIYKKYKDNNNLYKKYPTSNTSLENVNDKYQTNRNINSDQNKIQNIITKSSEIKKINITNS
jgi:hypothetical protein